MIGEDLTSNSSLYNDLFYSNNLVSHNDPVMDFEGAGGEETHKSSGECGGGAFMTHSGVR